MIDSQNVKQIYYDFQIQNAHLSGVAVLVLNHYVRGTILLNYKRQNTHCRSAILLTAKFVWQL